MPWDEYAFWLKRLDAAILYEAAGAEAPGRVTLLVPETSAALYLARYQNLFQEVAEKIFGTRAFEISVREPGGEQVAV